jgi:hypothetical protein
MFLREWTAWHTIQKHICKGKMPEKYELVWINLVQTLIEAKDFSSSPCVQTSSGAHPASYPMFTMFHSQSEAWLGHDWPLTPIQCIGQEWVGAISPLPLDTCMAAAGQLYFYWMNLRTSHYILIQPNDTAVMWNYYAPGKYLKRNHLYNEKYGYTTFHSLNYAVLAHALLHYSCMEPSSVHFLLHYSLLFTLKIQNRNVTIQSHKLYNQALYLL